MSFAPFIAGVGVGFLILIPLGLKWQIEKKVSVPAALILGLISGVFASGVSSFVPLKHYQMLALQVLTIGVLTFVLLTWRFFRDPERTPPPGEDIVLSPADGRIIYIKKTEDGAIPFSEKSGEKIPIEDFTRSGAFQSAFVIGIAMNFLDVHVNRSPVEGRVSLLKHTKGFFLSLKKKEALIGNERVLTVIENGSLRVGVLQIASRLVRRIVTYAEEGSEVGKGERIGMIKFGSQVDLLLPAVPSLKIKVQPGDKVKAGRSIVAEMKNPGPAVKKADGRGA